MTRSGITSKDVFAAALDHFRGGRVQEAAELCAQALAIDSENSDLLHLLALAVDRSGDPATAAAVMRRAIGIRPDAAGLHNDLGVLYRKLERPDEAAACYEAALRLDPDFAEAHRNAGNLLRDRGQPEQAIACYRRAVELRPGDAVAWNGMGGCLLSLGRDEEALAAFKSAVDASPGYAAAHRSLGLLFRARKRHEEAFRCFESVAALLPESAEAQNYAGAELLELERAADAAEHLRRAAALAPDSAEIQFNLGRALRILGEMEAAESCLRRALELAPVAPEALDELGIALSKQGKGEEALACFERAIAIAPERPEILCNLGHELLQQHRFQEATDHLNHAIRLKPDCAEAWNNLAGSLYADALIRGSKDLDGAEQCLRKAVEVKPDYADAHVNLALIRLLRGQFEAGWPEWQWRWRGKEGALHRFQRPMWSGEPLEGRTVLLHHEGGFGDTIQFVRYARVLRQLGAHVLVRCQKALRPVLSGCAGIDLLLDEDQPIPWFDVHAPLMSVPAILGTNFENIPAETPYILPDPDLTARWKVRINSYRGFKIGIAWQGNRKFKGDRRRSIPVAHFEPLSKIPGVRLFSLQTGFGQEQLTRQAGAWNIVDVGLPFVETAALMMSLDLIVTSDTSIAHLAGALGRPVWLALCCTPDWRWLLDRSDSPWYPTVRLFRQPGLDQWSAVFESMAAQLKLAVPKSSGIVPI